MKNNAIRCYADLEYEEIRVRKRIKKQEVEIRARLKQLPQEIVTIGITKALTAIVSGKIVESGKSILKSVVNYFFKKAENQSEGGGFKSMIANAIKNFVNNNENE